MDRAALLLVGSRSRLHRWLLRAASGGVAVSVGAATVLASTHGKHHPDMLWKVALIAVIVIAALTLVAAVGAYITQPVSETHAEFLKGLATFTLSGLTLGFSGFENDYEEQAFRSHFGRLHKKRARWNALREEAWEAREQQHARIDETLAEHGIVGDAYAAEAIRDFVMDMGLRRARGDAPLSDFDWTRNWGTTAVELGDPATPGPPEGWLAPYDGAPRWVILPPSLQETRAKWSERAIAHTSRIDQAMEALRVSSLAPYRAIAVREQEVVAFREAELPALREALRLIQIREPPRQRLRCKSC